ncbi:MAG: ImuA family protein [Pseudorhodoplanes sp.]
MPPQAAILENLRRTVGEIQGLEEISQAEQPLGLGVPDLDRALGSGLPRGTLHDLVPAAAVHLGATLGFGLALAIRASGGPRARPVLWLQTDFARLEAGALYGPGFAAFGLPMQRLIVLRAPRAADLLWAMEEALRCRALGAVVAELTHDSADLTATRRLSLAAREGGGFGLLLHHHPCLALTAAATRFEIASLPGPSDAHGGLSPTTFTLRLVKNRRGPCGRWTIIWDHHAGTFLPAFPFDLAAAAFDRPDRAKIAGVG